MDISNRFHLSSDSTDGLKDDNKLDGMDTQAGASVDSDEWNNRGQTASPGFLRGRGRGRPKLIGDELDAELVEYMVQVKFI